VLQRLMIDLECPDAKPRIDPSLQIRPGAVLPRCAAAPLAPVCPAHTFVAAGVRCAVAIATSASCPRAARAAAALGGSLALSRCEAGSTRVLL